MKRAARIDAHQPAIVQALRDMGATVYYIKEPVDLVVGYRGMTILMEVKNEKGKNRHRSSLHRHGKGAHK